MNRVQVPHEKTRALGVTVDLLTMKEAVQAVIGFLHSARQAPGVPCRIVVTPNLDHAVQLQENEALRAAYAGAALVLADGMPLVWASRLGPRPLPERVTGSAPGLNAGSSRRPAGSWRR